MAFMAADLIRSLNSGSLVVLDAYFAVGPVFLVLRELSESLGQRLAHLITRAKSNVVAYEDPPPKTAGRSAPRKYGHKLKLMSLFKQRRNDFQQTTLQISKDNKTILFLCLDLL